MKIFLPPSLIKVFGIYNEYEHMVVGGELYLIALPHTIPHMVS